MSFPTMRLFQGLYISMELLNAKCKFFFLKSMNDRITHFIISVTVKGCRDNKKQRKWTSFKLHKHIQRNFNFGNLSRNRSIFS